MFVPTLNDYFLTDKPTAFALSIGWRVNSWKAFAKNTVEGGGYLITLNCPFRKHQTYTSILLFQCNAKFAKRAIQYNLSRIPENTHRWGCITVWLFSSFTVMNLSTSLHTNKHLCWILVKSNLVKLEASHTVILSPAVSALCLYLFKCRGLVILSSFVALQNVPSFNPLKYLTFYWP